MTSDEAPAFSVETLDETGTTVVRASGEIDVATAPEIEARLVALIEAGGAVTLDLNDVTFIDSSGLRALVTARQKADERSVEFSLAGRSPAVDRLLEVTGLDAVFQQG